MESGAVGGEVEENFLFISFTATRATRNFATIKGEKRRGADTSRDEAKRGKAGADVGSHRQPKSSTGGWRREIEFLELLVTVRSARLLFRP